MTDVTKNGSTTFEIAHIKKDGTPLPVEVHSRVVELAGRLVTVCVARDITERMQANEALKQEKNFSSAVLDTAGALVLVLDREGRIVRFNRACEQITGYTFEEVKGKYVFDIFILPNEREDVKGVFSSLRAGMFPNSYENYWRTKDGGQRLIAWTNTCLVGPDGEVQWVIPTGVDITESNRVENELRKLSRAVEQSPNMVMIADIKGALEYVNPKFVQVTGYIQEEIVGRNLISINQGSRTAEEHKQIQDVISSGGEWHGEFLARKKNGDLYWQSASVSPVKNTDGDITHILAVMQDITERKQAEDMINYMSYYDSLTELPNRILFNDRLSLALARARRNKDTLALLYLDLDSFKTINDTLGHDLGDQILQDAAKRLKDCINEGDTLARLGGDEFVILLPQVSGAEGAAKTAYKIFETIKPPFKLNGHELYITTSVGISLYPHDGKDAQTLVKHAEVALYRAKEQGRSSYQLYTAAMNAKAFERLAMESDLRKALERKEFEIYYQPQIDLDTGKIVSMEVLLRWNHPTLGPVSPAEFVPIAEETGLIVPIGEWVIWMACAQNKAWQDEGHPPTCISVNLSARQFQQQDLVSMIDFILNETGMDPRYLELEITERAIIEDADAAIAVMNELKDRNIRIAIDDFGTGYSSLGYLKKFPIDRLKIDILFIHTLITDPNDAAIVSAIIAMAHSLGLRAVAEGVETLQQFEFLRSLHCDEMQGFLYSEPLPTDEAVKLFYDQPKELRKYWLNRDIRSA